MRLLGASTSILLAGVIALAPQPVAGQQITRGISIGRSQVDSPFNRHTHEGVTGAGKGGMGWQLQAFVEWAPESGPLGFRGEALYNRLTTGGNMSPAYARSDQVLAVGGAVLWPQPGANEGFAPYLIVGGSIFANRLGLVSALGREEIADVRWGWGPALNAGAGFSANVFGVRTGLEIRMHQATFSGRGSGWIGFSVPLLW